MPDRLQLAPRPAFAGLLEDAGPAETAGVIASERVDLQIAAVIARNARDAPSARVRSAYALDLPTGPGYAAAERIAFVGTGPGTWLAIRAGDGSLADELRRELGGTAAIADQSDGLAVLRLSGTGVRATFEKGLGIDLHPRAFGPGDAAITACHHLSVALWQLDAAPTYEIALSRSYAGAFWRWLGQSAADCGLKVASGG